MATNYGDKHPGHGDSDASVCGGAEFGWLDKHDLHCLSIELDLCQPGTGGGGSRQLSARTGCADCGEWRLLWRIESAHRQLVAGWRVGHRSASPGRGNSWARRREANFPSPGLYEVSIQSQAPQGLHRCFRLVTTNFAVQPNFQSCLAQSSACRCHRLRLRTQISLRAALR